jgi:hypothetical protein
MDESLYRAWLRRLQLFLAAAPRRPAAPRTQTARPA